MKALRRCVMAAISLVAALLVLAACSSESDGDVAEPPAADGGGAQAAAATGAETGKMLDTPVYKIAQEFPLTLEVSSTVFSRIRRIPIEYTCVENYYYPEAGLARYGEDKSPPLTWTAGPEGTKSYAMVADDPDSVELEKGILSPRVHWVIWNIPAEVTALDERVATTSEVLAIGPTTRQGVNDLEQIGWSGPCPPPNISSIVYHLSDSQKLQKAQLPHAYLFTVYALDAEFDLAAGATKNDLLAAMDGHILAAGEIKGEYVNKKLFK